MRAQEPETWHKHLRQLDTKEHDLYTISYLYKVTKWDSYLMAS